MKKIILPLALLVVSLLFLFVTLRKDRPVNVISRPDPECKQTASYTYVQNDNTIMSGYQDLMDQVSLDAQNKNTSGLVVDAKELSSMRATVSLVKPPELFLDYQKVELAFLDYKIRYITALSENHQPLADIYSRFAEREESMLADTIWEATLKCHPDWR